MPANPANVTVDAQANTAATARIFFFMIKSPDFRFPTKDLSTDLSPTVSALPASAIPLSATASVAASTAPAPSAPSDNTSAPACNTPVPPGRHPDLSAYAYDSTTYTPK